MPARVLIGINNFMNNNNKRNKDNPTDSWLAPEHVRSMEYMVRPKYGIRDKQGLYLVRPGERILPVPAILRQQREAAARMPTP